MRQAIAVLGALPAKQQPNRGLVFDTMLQRGEVEDAQAKARLMQKVVEIPIPPSYRDFVRRWEQSLRALPATELYRAEKLSPVLVGLGTETVSEVALTLHRTYGVPLLPGSALKGLAAAYARNRLDPGTWGKDTEAYRILFGTTEEAGYVTFHDALMLPDREQGDLRRDVLTVHHQAYYAKGAVPPADWDSPVPVPMLVAHANFILPLTGPEAWRKAAHGILKLALAEEGIGAKTSSGYGRLNLGGRYQVKATKASAAPVAASAASVDPSDWKAVLANRFNSK